TCALPIFRSLSSTPTPERRPGWMSWGYNPTASVARREKSLSRIVTSCSRGPSEPVGLSISILSPRDHSCYPARKLCSGSLHGYRSEERRVGKESRCGGYGEQGAQK